MNDNETVTNAILTSKRYLPTAKRLGEALGLPVHQRALSKVLHYINWGHWEATTHISVFPHPNRVTVASHKADFKRRLVQSGLWTKPFGEIGPGHRVPETFPVIARYPRHTMGKGLAFCRSLGEFARLPKEFSYWTEFIGDPDRSEYRIHVTPKGDVIARRRKFRKAPCTDVMQDVVRNYRNGWRYALLDTAKPVVVRAAKEAAVLFGRAYGLGDSVLLAVDVLESNGTAEVLEINLFPGLSYQPVLDMYVEYFRKYLDTLGELKPSGGIRYDAVNDRWTTDEAF